MNSENDKLLLAEVLVRFSGIYSSPADHDAEVVKLLLHTDDISSPAYNKC